MVEKPTSATELVENSSGHSWYTRLRSRITPPGYRGPVRMWKMVEM